MEKIFEGAAKAKRGRPRKTAMAMTNGDVKKIRFEKYAGNDLTLVQIDEKLDVILGLLR